MGRILKCDDAGLYGEISKLLGDEIDRLLDEHEYPCIGTNGNTSFVLFVRTCVMAIISKIYFELQTPFNFKTLEEWDEETDGGEYLINYEFFREEYEKKKSLLNREYDLLCEFIYIIRGIDTDVDNGCEIYWEQ